MNGKRFFTRRLGSTSYRPTPEAEFEVQVIGADGQTERCVYIGRAAHEVVAVVHAAEGELPVSAHGVPQAVIDAACQRTLKNGEYVDQDGNVVQPAFLARRRDGIGPARL